MILDVLKEFCKLIVGFVYFIILDNLELREFLVIVFNLIDKEVLKVY